MGLQSSELLRVIDSFKQSRVVVIGDLLLDEYIWGQVERISPEAPVVVVRQTEESKRLGGAGNVVHNLIALGAQVSVCGVVGDDDAGRVLVSMLETLGADTDGVLIDRTRPTPVKTRVIAHGQQVVRVDREHTGIIAPTYQEGIAAHLESQLSHASGVVVSDYAKGTISPPLFNRIEKGYAEGSLGAGKIPVLVDPKAPNFSLYRGATVIKPNRKEAEEASLIRIHERKDAIRAGKKLLEKWNTEMVLITLGELGMVLVAPQDGENPEVEVDTVARDVFDVSGAGDTVSAAFLLSLAAGATCTQAANISNIAAGIVVGEVGTVAVKFDDLQKTISHYGD